MEYIYRQIPPVDLIAVLLLHQFIRDMANEFNPKGIWRFICIPIDYYAISMSFALWAIVALTFGVVPVVVLIFVLYPILFGLIAAMAVNLPIIKNKFLFEDSGINFRTKIAELLKIPAFIFSVPYMCVVGYWILLKNGMLS